VCPQSLPFLKSRFCFLSLPFSETIICSQISSGSFFTKNRLIYVFNLCYLSIYLSMDFLFEYIYMYEFIWFWDVLSQNMQHKSAEKYDFNGNPLPPEGGCAHPRWWRGPSPQSKLSRRMHSFFKGCDIRLLYIARERERERERDRYIYIYTCVYNSNSLLVKSTRVTFLSDPCQNVH